MTNQIRHIPQTTGAVIAATICDLLLRAFRDKPRKPFCRSVAVANHDLDQSLPRTLRRDGWWLET